MKNAIFVPLHLKFAEKVCYAEVAIGPSGALLHKARYTDAKGGKQVDRNIVGIGFYNKQLRGTGLFSDGKPIRLFNRRSLEQPRWRFDRASRNGMLQRVFGPCFLLKEEWERLRVAAGDPHHPLFHEYCLLTMAAVCAARKDAVISGFTALWFYGYQFQGDRHGRSWDAQAIQVLTGSRFNEQQGAVPVVCLGQDKVPAADIFEFNSCYGLIRIQRPAALLQQMCYRLHFEQAVQVVESAVANYGALAVGGADAAVLRPRCKVTLGELQARAHQKQRYIRQFRAVLAAIAVAAESPRESSCRLRLWQAGVRNILLQPKVFFREQGERLEQFVGRIDMMVAGVAVEYDGAEKYSVDQQRLFKEKARTMALVKSLGFVVTVTNDNFWSGTWVEQVKQMCQAAPAFQGTYRLDRRGAQMTCQETMSAVMRRYRFTPRLTVQGVTLAGWQQRLC